MDMLLEALASIKSALTRLRALSGALEPDWAACPYMQQICKQKEG
jgi:hypothetical protein